MLLGEEWRWNLVTFFIHVVIPAATMDVLESQKSIHTIFKIPTFLSLPKNLASNFQRQSFANIQLDVFIDAKTADSRMANLIVENYSRNSSLVISSSLKNESHDAIARNNNTSISSKLKNVILIYNTACDIDLKFLKTLFGNRWNPRASIIVYIEDVDNMRASEILLYFWKHDLLNVALTIQTQSSEEPFENFIYNPFLKEKSSGHRGKVEKFNSGDFMFPDKLANLHNHSIPISIFAYYPKVSLRNWKHLKSGADVEVLKALSTKLNFSIDMKTAPVFGISYTIRLPNGEEVGMIGDLLVNRSDIIWTSQHMEATFGYPVEFTYPTLQTRYCVLVPKAKMMPMIARMALPFPEVIWIAIIMVIALLLISFTLIGEKKKFIQISQLLLHHRFENIPKRTPNRILAISCILWAYLMSCMYQANFINELILPKYYKDLDTLEELYASGLPLLVSADMVKVLNNSEVPIYQKLAKRTVLHLVFRECVDQLLKSFNVSCGVDEYISVRLSEVYKKNKNTLATHSVKECLGVHWDVYVAKEGFPYLEKFNQLIRGLLEGGLYRKWVVDLVKHRPTRGPRGAKFTIKHCEAVFGVLFAGLSISAIAFILEHAKFRFFSNRKTNKAFVSDTRNVE